MGKLIDAFARNRTKIGTVLTSLAMLVVTVDPWVITQYPRLSAYAVGLFAIVFGAGKFKSDKFQRDRQGL